MCPQDRKGEVAFRRPSVYVSQVIGRGNEFAALNYKIFIPLSNNIHFFKCYDSCPEETADRVRNPNHVATETCNK
jgi:hypothetical protein